MKLLLTACAAFAAGAMMTAPAFAKDSDEDAIRSMMAAANARWVACDTEAWGKYDAPDRTVFYPDSMDVQSDGEGAKEQEVQFCKSGGKHELTNYKIDKVIVMGDSAIALGSGHYKQVMGDGAVPVDSDFNFTDVLVRAKDGWKFKHSHIGVVMPPPDEAPVSE